MNITVTPGIDLTAISGPISKTQLNALGQPVVAVQPGTVEGSDLDLPSVREALALSGRGENFLRNGNFASNMWSRGSSAVSCPAAAITYRADWWGALPNGAAVTYEREAAGPANNKSYHCAKLTGATSVGIVDFLQDIPLRLSTALRQQITVSFWIYNSTGANLTPLVRLDTANAADVFTAVTNRYSANAGSAVANATWQQYTHTFDATAFTNMTNGARFIIRFPSGSLDSGSKYVRIAQVKLEIGEEASTFSVERDEVSEGTASDPVRRNYLDNANFSRNRWVSTSVTATASTDNTGPESWFINPAGASTLVISRSTSTPGTTALDSLLLTGGAGTNAVDVGQNIESHVAGLTRRTVTFSVYIYNGTGSSFTPKLRVDTCASTNSFTSVTNLGEMDLDACPNNAWTRVSYTFDGSLLSNWSNGARIYVRIPSGSLDNNSKTVLFSQAQLCLGTAAQTVDPEPELVPETATLGNDRGLQIARASVSTLTVQFDEMTLRTPAGRSIVARCTSPVTVNIATSGLNGLDTGAEANSTWYYIWVVANGVGGVGAILSTSATAPTVPAGYNYRALKGVVRNNSGGDFINFSQRGREVAIAPQAVFSAKGPAVAGTYETVKTAATAGVLESILPPTAIAVRANIGRTSTGGAGSKFAADANGLGEVCVTTPSSSVNFSSFWNPCTFNLSLATSQDFFWTADATSAVMRLEISGYTLST